MQLLEKLGIFTKQEASDFLFPKLKDLPKPSLMKGLDEAVALAVQYIEADHQIVVWGDYDVDGTTATALLVNFFRALGVDVIHHIPNRLTEGYGLNTDWFKDHIGSFSTKRFLLITVDCGISNHKEIEVIKGWGADVIVTDHHTIPVEGLPRCHVLNPSQHDCGFHNEKIAGVGVAFYLIAGLRAALVQSKKYCKAVERINLKNYLCFVALGTVADLVEITRTNRILIRAGLETLSETPFTGIATLLESCDLYGDTISSEDIGFIIGPKINAAGRLGNSDAALGLFISQNATESKKAVAGLERLNEERKRICEDDYNMALARSSSYETEDQCCCICVGEYHLGVAGIVASRLVENYGVPAIVFAEIDEDSGLSLCKGSVRSIEGVSVIRALEACSDHIYKYGGHDMAAGLTVLTANMDSFRNEFSKQIKLQLKAADRVARKKLTIEANVDDVMSRQTLDYLYLFEPYGPGNDAPVFEDRLAKVIKANTVGKFNSHLNIVVRGEYSNYKGIGFNLGERISDVQESPERRIYFSPTKNRYRGTVSWQLRIIDL